MTQIRRWQRFGLASGLVVLLALPACTITVEPGIDRATDDVDLTASSSGVTTLLVRWKAGNVTIEFDDSLSEAVLTGTTRALGRDAEDAENRLSQVTVTLEPDPNDASILRLTLTGPVVSSTFPWSADVMLTLPAGVTLDIESEAGNVNVTGNAGSTTIALEAGNVSVADNTGAVDIELDTGEIFLSRTTGTATMTFDNGDASITGQEGNLNVSFGNGDVGIQSNSGNVAAAGSNGDITIATNPPADGFVTAELANGDIEIAVPDDFAADLDLQTVFGVVRDDLSAFTVTNLNRSGSTISREVTATLNGGGGTISADIVTGTIRFEAL